jgi:hypothetical protein
MVAGASFVPAKRAWHVQSVCLSRFSGNVGDSRFAMRGVRGARD